MCQDLAAISETWGIRRMVGGSAICTGKLNRSNKPTKAVKVSHSNKPARLQRTVGSYGCHPRQEAVRVRKRSVGWGANGDNTLKGILFWVSGLASDCTLFPGP